MALEASSSVLSNPSISLPRYFLLSVYVMSFDVSHSLRQDQLEEYMIPPPHALHNGPLLILASWAVCVCGGGGGGEGEGAGPGGGGGVGGVVFFSVQCSPSVISSPLAHPHFLNLSPACSVRV